MVIIYEDETQLNEKCRQYEEAGATLVDIETITEAFKRYDKAQKEYEKALKEFKYSTDKNKVEPEKPNIKSPISIGEAVGILLYTKDLWGIKVLDKSYRPMLDLMKRILYRNKYYTSNRKSKVTVKYNDENYIFTDIMEWETPLDKDGVRHIHKLNQLIKTKVAEQKEYVADKKERTFIRTLLAYSGDPTKYNPFIQKLPDDADNLIETFAPLYDIQIRYNSEFELEDKIRAYQSIKWYLDNNIEYCKDILGYKPDEEKMFEAVSFGREDYFEDYVYQNA